MKKTYLFFLFIFTVTTFISCKSSSLNLFKTASPHEEFKRKLETAGLDKTAMGAAWISAASTSMKNALTINIPYKETGYFDGSLVSAEAYIFPALAGQKITITLAKKPVTTAIYIDLWNLVDASNPKKIGSADSSNNPIQYEIEVSGNYLIRLQPELLQNAEYTLEISSSASLAFPTQSGRKKIGSYWGDGRDNNSRKHEGVDIFGSFRSPVLAAADGVVTGVNENNLGGKVVWLRPIGKEYTLYYAHLDEQIAVEGQSVKIGDTIGLMGNTGNAKTTPTHLHFGIYTSNGAIDPMPFINPDMESAPKIRGDITQLNRTLRTKSKTDLYSAPQTSSKFVSVLPTGTIVQINAVSENQYKVKLPNGKAGFVNSDKLISIAKPLQKLKINAARQKLYSKPDLLAPIKINLNIGQTVSVLGNFSNFQLINDEKSHVGWILK